MKYDGLTTFNQTQSGEENNNTVFSNNSTIDGTQPIHNVTIEKSTIVDAKSSDVSIEKGGIILNLYNVESDPLVGGMGKIFRVHHTGWNVDLALKQPKQELFQNEHQKAMFVHECEAWINLGLHSHIVSYYDVREIGGTLSIFSEWMECDSLKGFINRNVYLLKNGGIDDVEAIRLLKSNPEIEGGWLRGIWHGGNVVGNFILSFFDEDRLLQAPLHTAAYSFLWWISMIFSVLLWIIMCINMIKIFRVNISGKN